MLGGDIKWRGVNRFASPEQAVSSIMSEQEVRTCVEQRVIVKFLSQEGVKPAETLSRIHVYDWHEKICEGRELVQNETHVRRSWTSTSETHILEIREMSEGDHHLII